MIHANTAPINRPLTIVNNVINAINNGNVIFTPFNLIL